MIVSDRGALEEEIGPKALGTESSAFRVLR
jgi:hypothetical protein